MVSEKYVIDCKNTFAFSGGSILSDAQLDACVSKAMKRGAELRQLIDETLLTVER